MNTTNFPYTPPGRQLVRFGRAVHRPKPSAEPKNSSEKFLFSVLLACHHVRELQTERTLVSSVLAMSFSFPSSSGWEPASQRTLGWRGTASRRAGASVAAVPRAERWARLRPNAPARPPAGSASTPQSAPAPSPPGESQDATAAAAQFAQGERESRLLAEVERGTSVARVTRTGVEEISSALRAQAEVSERHVKTISEEIAKARRAVHTCDARRDVNKAASETQDILRETLRSFAVAHERTLDGVLEKALGKELEKMRADLVPNTQSFSKVSENISSLRKNLDMQAASLRCEMTQHVAQLSGDVCSVRRDLGTQVASLRSDVGKLTGDVSRLTGDVSRVHEILGRMEKVLSTSVATRAVDVDTSSVPAIASQPNQALAPRIGLKKPPQVYRGFPKRGVAGRKPKTRGRAVTGGKGLIVRPLAVKDEGISKTQAVRKSPRLKSSQEFVDGEASGGTSSVLTRTAKASEASKAVGSESFCVVKEEVEMQQGQSGGDEDSLFDESDDGNMEEQQEEKLGMNSTLAPWMFENEMTKEADSVPLRIRLRLSNKAVVRTRSMARRCR